jgi:hypothetical protein
VDSHAIMSAVSIPGSVRAWLRVEAAIAVVAATFALVAVPLIGTPTDRLREQLNARVTTILEHVSPAEHHSHGHDVGAADTIICTAETFGWAPASATSVEQVQWVYAYFLCASAPSGTDWDFAARISGPTAVSLTEPPQVRIAAAGLGYPDRVREMIPPDLQARAFGGFVDHDLPAALLKRYNDEIANAK